MTFGPCQISDVSDSEGDQERGSCVIWQHLEAASSSQDRERAEGAFRLVCIHPARASQNGTTAVVIGKQQCVYHCSETQIIISVVILKYEEVTILICTFIWILSI